MQRRAATNGANDLHAGALAPGAIDVDDFVSLLHREIDSLPGQFVQGAHRVDRCLAHVKAPLDERTEFQQAHAELIETIIDPLDIATNHHVVENPVRRRRMQARRSGELLQRDGFSLRGQGVEQVGGALKHLNCHAIAWGNGHGYA